MNPFPQTLMSKTAQWRQTMVQRFPDDERNARAAAALEILATADPNTVDPATWQALESHAGKPELRDAINTTARETGFIRNPATLNDFLNVVLTRL